MAKKENKTPADASIDALEAKQAPVVSAELTAEEMLHLEKEARDEVAKELKDAKRREFKAAAKQRLKKQSLFKAGTDDEGDFLVPTTINLAPHAPYIRLDNAVYYHNCTYQLTLAKAQTINDIMYRTWQHDAEINGLDQNAFNGRQKIHAVLRPTTH